MFVAHRGESYLAPENTLAAFNLAWKKGAASAVELDIRLTKDGAVVVCHDPDTNRLSDKNMVIAESTLEQLRNVDMGSHKQADWAGERIPTLAQALDTTPQNGHWFIEIKSGLETVLPLRQIIEKSQLDFKQITVMAFDSKVILETRKNIPEVRALWLSGPTKDQATGQEQIDLSKIIDTAKKINCPGVSLCNGKYLDREFIAALHDANLQVYVWTVDDPKRARQLLDDDIDGLITNRPAFIKTQINDA